MVDKMAEANVTELPAIILEDFTANDSFLIIDDGKLRRLTKVVFSEWVAANVQGVQGIQGVAGRDGAKGTNGLNGTNGTNGLSAYQLAVANGFAGTVTQWLASQKGADGVAGAAGGNGWSPVFKIETSAGGSHLKIVDWVGGTGTKPTTLGYISESGVVQNTLTATNLKGDKGDRGLQGDTGAQGVQGVTGIQGVQGETGYSPYDLAIANGFVGTEAEWLASLNPAEVSADAGNILSKKIDGMYAPTPDPLTIATGIDALADKNIMTDAQRDKLASLETSKFLGTFLTAGDIPTVGAISGNYADVDSGLPDVDTERWIYDVQEASFVKSISIPAGETSESIKSKYESNANTNALTDELLLKINSTTAGAKGDTGDIGLTGAKGDKGDKGDTGDSGIAPDFGVGYVNFYQASKVSKDPIIPSPPAAAPQAPSVGGVNLLSEAAFTADIVGDTGWMILEVKNCTTTDWAITRNGVVIATWDYLHPDVLVKVMSGSTVIQDPIQADFLSMVFTIYIGEDRGMVNYKVISNCEQITYTHDGVSYPFARIDFTKLPDVTNFRIKAPKSILTVPTVLPSSVTSLQKAFEGSDNFNDPNIVGWDVSNVSIFSSMLSGCTKFNQPIGVWNMSNARDIDMMFNGATDFVQPISAWNTRYVISMVGILAGASSQDLSMWCVPMLSNYAYSSMLSGLGLTSQHMPIWGTCPRGEDSV